MKMVPRKAIEFVWRELEIASAVCLLGPRQVGKTTLALQIAKRLPSIYLDLESPRDLAKLEDAEAYLERHRDKLVILDELHQKPELLPILRGQIDQARREGKGTGRYLLLGSASLEVLRKTGESLAGRLHYVELTPIQVFEAEEIAEEKLWLRGGFPQSFLAEEEEISFGWRSHFFRTYLERDLPFFGGRMASETLRRFWTMLAHLHGDLYQASGIARNLGIDVRTVNRYVDLLVDLFLIRRLSPWSANLGKRLVKSPKLYWRDSGLLHSLLKIQDLEELLSHPIVGTSWEGFVIENLLAAGGRNVEGYYYRTAGGAEVDLLLLLPRGELWAVEIKRSSAPTVSRGFSEACRDLEPQGKFVVYPGKENFPLRDGIEACPLKELCQRLASI